jgi:hypothetical protein
MSVSEGGAVAQSRCAPRQRALASTNPCGSMIQTVRRISRNVERWHSGDMPALDGRRNARGQEAVPARHRRRRRASIAEPALA